MKSDNSASISSKVWNFPPSPFGLRRPGAHVLKNARVGYGDYAEKHRIVAEVETRTTVAPRNPGQSVLTRWRIRLNIDNPAAPN